MSEDCNSVTVHQLIFLSSFSLGVSCTHLAAVGIDVLVTSILLCSTADSDYNLLSAQCSSSIGQIIKSVCVSVSE